MNRPRAQSSAKWVLGAALLIAAVVAIVFITLRLTSPLVTVTDAVDGPVVQAFYSTGTVQPEREFPIKSNVAGIIGQVLVDKGDRVKKDQPLAIVSDPELMHAQQRARAELEEKQKRADAKTSPVVAEYDARISATKDMLEIAKREVQRIEPLIARAAAAQTDLDNANDRLKTVWAQLESLKAQRSAKLLELEKELAFAQAALATADWNVQQQTLKSPIEGVVLDRPLSIGTRVAINDSLMRVADIAPAKLIMRASVDEEDIIKVRKDQIVRMTLYSYADRSFEGRVQKIYDQADAERRTFEVDVKMLEPDERLSPGMTGELAFEMASRDHAIVIPTQAVQKGGSVFVVEGGRLKNAQVGLGLRGIERTEVRSGMKAGDKVVISAIADLKEGKRVRTSYLDPVSAAGLNKPKVATDAFKGFKQ